MQFFWIVLSVLCYLLGQTWIVLSVLCYLLGQTAVVDARAIGLQKSAFTFPNHNDYQEDSYQLKTERKRQAGT